MCHPVQLYAGGAIGAADAAFTGMSAATADPATMATEATTPNAAAICFMISPQREVGKFNC